MTDPLTLTKLAMEQRRREQQQLKNCESLYVKTWTEDFGVMYEIGTEIYRQIFQANPKAIVLFPKFADYPGDTWKDAPEFRNQALKFVQTLARALQNLHSLETSVDPYLNQIGRLHVRFVPNGFDPSYWSVFETAIQAAMRKHVELRTQLDETTKAMAIEAWVLLAHYIIERMRDGFEAALLERAEKERKPSRLFAIPRNFQRSNSTS